jgi:ubiquinone/menaquinone biosynthesis C-methylase UbiE
MKLDLLKYYFEWDVKIWSNAIYIWRESLDKLPPSKKKLALEIGGRNGGLSYFLANEYNCSVICSDLKNPIDTAKPLHLSYNAKLNITYAEENCLNLSYEDNTFDIIIFKSVLGALGDQKKQQQAINEIWRVLKPGGVLCFAENLRSTYFHQVVRKIFNPWSRYWYYPSVAEFSDSLNKFRNTKYNTLGFTSLFFRNEKYKSIFEFVDYKLQSVIPNTWNYVIFGTAIK